MNRFHYDAPNGESVTWVIVYALREIHLSEHGPRVDIGDPFEFPEKFVDRWIEKGSVRRDPLSEERKRKLVALSERRFALHHLGVMGVKTPYLYGAASNELRKGRFTKKKELEQWLRLVSRFRAQLGRNGGDPHESNADFLRESHEEIKRLETELQAEHTEIDRRARIPTVAPAIDIRTNGYDLAYLVAGLSKLAAFKQKDIEAHFTVKGEPILSIDQQKSKVLSGTEYRMSSEMQAFIRVLIQNLSNDHSDERGRFIGELIQILQNHIKPKAR